jgi:flagellum-specific ATP synthase
MSVDPISNLISNIVSAQDQLSGKTLFGVAGKVTRVVGLTIEVKGIKSPIGNMCEIVISGQKKIPAEIVGFKDNISILMPLGDLEGISPGCKVIPRNESFNISVGPELLGNVINGLGEVISQEKLSLSETCPIHNNPPHPLKRKNIDSILETGVKAIDALLTCGIGQRMGIFAGSGVGKSTLLGTISRNSSADVNVIALIGERGREVREFIDRDLGPEGLARSVVVVATSDQPALQRVKAALVATSIAEYFRDQGKNVLLMMDSVTRFAMAQREIGLAVGEPPTSRGYTPSVFALLPKLLERAGNAEKGSITGLYTILVEGDDMNEPIADAARRIIKRPTDDGTSVNIGVVCEIEGIEAFLPIQELSHGWVNDVNDLIQPGDTFNAKIIEVDKDKRKLTLSVKALTDGPWPDCVNRYSKNSFYAGIVTGALEYGVFVNLEPGLDAFCKLPKSGRVHEGDSVSIIITRISAEEQRINGVIHRILRKAV